MGDTISSLVFRPPKPTPIHPADYFYIDVDVHSPLCTNRIHFHNKDEQPHGGCFVGSTMCLETGESDLASLDTSFINGEVCTSPLNANEVQDVVPNVRNGQVYRVPAFFIRRRNATQTILFSHGNAEDLGMMYPRMKDLAMLFGVNILAYDYTGYGLSIPGPLHRNCPNGGGGGGNDGNGSSNEGPSENMIYRNIEAAYRYLTRVRKIPPHKIILYGRSLGSGPACYLAAKTSLSGNPVGGLILHSPFLSVYKVVADLNGLDLGMVGDLFHNEKRARNVRCPTLIIHGRDDEVVPFWHAPRLLAAIPPEFRAQPYYVDGMGHNHIESRCRERYVKVVLNFLTMGACNENLYGSSPTVVAHRGPTPVPINERASHSETGENPTFYVNKTWLRHAKVLLRDVFSDVGCYVNNTVDRDVRTKNSTQTSVRSRGKIVGSVPAAAATTSAVWHPAATEAQSDARDDEDEFAPWMGENRLRRRQQELAYRAQHPSTESILNTRPSPISYRQATSPKYQKSQSMMIPSSSPRRVTSPSEQEQQLGYCRSKSVVLPGMSHQRRY